MRSIGHLQAGKSRKHTCQTPKRAVRRSVSAGEKLLMKIKSEMRRDNVEKVLDLIDLIPFNERTPQILVIQGINMQLSNREWELSDIEKCFRRALKIDSNYIDAMINLAYFLDVVQCEPQKALYWFRRATKLTQSIMKEIQNGIKGVYETL